VVIFKEKELMLKNLKNEHSLSITDKIVKKRGKYIIAPEIM